MNHKIIHNSIGWFGTALILIAYTLTTFGFLSTNNLIYPLANGAGALGLIYTSFKKKDYPPGVLNIIWFTIALVAIVKFMIVNS
jgi:hypothetical protein